SARTARRLRDDFELDGHGLAVALNLLRRIRELEAQLTHAQAKLPQ
ncbi:chaperone modulator CbpM, partial [Cryobacterium sp. RTS3]